MIQKLKLAKIVTDAGTDVRDKINDSVVEEYSEAAKNGAKFPPLIAFNTPDKEIVLADGFHRFFAFEAQGMKEWEVDVRQGTVLDALKFALGCNDEHGYRRTNADKRNAVEIALKKFADHTDRAIAEMCNVSHVMVGNFRKSQAPALPPPRPASTAAQNPSAPTPPPPRRQGKDGKKYGNKNSAPPPRPPVPPVPVTMDATHHPVPEETIPHWDASIAESTRLMSQTSELRARLKIAQDRDEPMFRGMNLNDVIAKLDQVYADLKLSKPYAVCIECQGVLTGGIERLQAKGSMHCNSCKGNGWVSQFFWDSCVPEDMKKAAGRE